MIYFQSLFIKNFVNKFLGYSLVTFFKERFIFLNYAFFNDVISAVAHNEQGLGAGGASTIAVRLRL